MPDGNRTIEVLMRRERRPDGLALLCLFVAMALFTGRDLSMDDMDVGPIERIPAFSPPSTVMLVICVWQSAGFAIARIELLRDGQ